MSDNSTPPAPGGYPYTPPPAAPPVPPPPTQAYPGAPPAYGQTRQSPAAVQQYGVQQQPYGYAQSPYPVYPAPRPTSGLAITSLVCALVSVLFSWLVLPILVAVAAVITGHMALKKTKSDPTVGGRGMAFAGLIIGYVVLGIGVLLIAITVFTFVVLGAFTIPFIYAS